MEASIGEPEFEIDNCNANGCDLKLEYEFDMEILTSKKLT